MNADSNQSCCGGRRFFFVLAIVAGCLFFYGIVCVTKKYTQPKSLMEARKVERRSFLRDLRAVEAEALNSPALLDPAKGIVRLPITNAMQIIEREWQNPAQARSNLIARVEKATALPPKAPEKPSAFE